MYYPYHINSIHQIEKLRLQIEYEKSQNKKNVKDQIKDKIQSKFIKSTDKLVDSDANLSYSTTEDEGKQDQFSQKEQDMLKSIELANEQFDEETEEIKYIQENKDEYLQNLAKEKSNNKNLINKYGVDE